MTLPCLAPSPRISLVMTGTPGALAADIIPSELIGNGLFLAADGLYAPGYQDLLGLGFPTVPVGSLPGDLLVKTSPASNISWTFRYNPYDTTGNKWEFVGGADFHADIETLGTINSNQPSGTMSVWEDLHVGGDTGPVFNVPFSGTYNIAFGADINPLPGESAQVGLGIGGADPTDDDTATAGTPGFASVMRRQQKALNSGDVVQLMYRGSGGSGTTAKHDYTRRWISVHPVHVGGARGATYGGT